MAPVTPVDVHPVPAGTETGHGSPAGAVKDPTAYLFNARNADGYTAQVLQGVTAVAAKVSRCTRPFTGATPGELKSRVDGVDLGTRWRIPLLPSRSWRASTCATPSISMTPNTRRT